MTPEEAGKAFVASVLNRIPDDQRAGLQTLVESTPELAVALGEGVLRQEDYSRGMDAVNARAREQQSWWEQNQPLVDLGVKAKAAGFAPAATAPTKPDLTTPATLPDDVIRREDLNREAADHARFMMVTNQLTMNHYKEFNEVLDLVALSKDPRVKDIGLLGVYEATVAPRRAEAAKATTEAEITKRVNEQLAASSRNRENPNFPSGKLPTGSPLDALQPVAPGKADVGELVDAYYSIVAGNGVPAPAAASGT